MRLAPSARAMGSTNEEEEDEEEEEQIFVSVPFHGACGSSSRPAGLACLPSLRRKREGRKDERGGRMTVWLSGQCTPNHQDYQMVLNQIVTPAMEYGFKISVAASPGKVELGIRGVIRRTAYEAAAPRDIR